MFKRLGRKNKGKNLKDELEHMAQMDEFNEIDLEQLEVKEYKPVDKKTSIDYSHILDSVDNFKNRAIYPQLTLEILSKIDNSDLIQVIFDNLITKVGEDFDNEFQVVSSFNEERQAIYSTWVWTSEMDNGGFLQFYENSSSQFSNTVEKGLKLLKANSHILVMNQANKLWRKGSREFEKLDNQYYDLSEKENLDDIQTKFIRHNVECFLD